MERLAWLGAIVTIVGFPIAIYQLWDLGEQRTLRSLQVAMHVDQQLSNGVSVRIKHAIEKRRSLLKEHGGEFTREELSDYLDIFTALGDAYERKLITKDVIYVWHGYTIARAFETAEIRAFVTEERKQDPEFYEGFESLAAEVIAEEKGSASKRRQEKRPTK